MKTTITLFLSFTLVAFGLKSQIPQDQLSAYYTFYSDPSSPSQYSLNTAGLDAAVWVGNVTPTLDRFGNENCALAFDGDPTSLLLIQTSESFDPSSTNELSISLWIKGGSSEPGDLEVLFKRNSFNGNTSPYSFALYDLNKPVMFTDESSLWAEDNEFPFPADENWHHLVAIFEAGSWKMYIDNNIEVTQDAYGPQTLPEAGPGEYIFGDIIMGENFEGTIDDVIFYKKALNSDEVNMLFNATSDCGVVGIFESESDVDIDLYPNPSSDQITIDLKNNLADYLEVYNTVGQLVLSSQIDPFEITNLDVTSLAEGMYSMRLFWNNELMGEEKLMIQK